MAVTILAPISGTVMALADVEDPVFAEELVGPGVAIRPDLAGRAAVVSPVSGRVVKLHPHAFVVQGDEAHGAVAVLVHLGIDTVQLAGEGFALHVAEGDDVTAGQPLVTWDPAEVERGGRSSVCPVVVLEGKPESVARHVDPGSRVDQGERLLDWS
ncbi:PTS sugar transporter subunit IIA [Cellulomonas chengniuliangii]|uniref:PTS glucose transporter subunit IIA n=1 Tax=Cellulomonas chengniuliangii TaxID=2968084 RepID=A0ABY5L6W7_9CELL|nr:PTS glucose transporter subunit IIA [Cellulomonas chengniuliangii]MCC2309886.1 PTS glucose transporter subunit IIA [Cellulomonas chengniuliangii]MCC2318145.1 PTS glucose transporter subunit IIA [Cellulomonas chengniuliangii]UUI76328.1 PTS glucose transporter subunit IIA [Cellulomonas chengniuliangii]